MPYAPDIIYGVVLTNNTVSTYIIQETYDQPVAPVAPSITVAVTQTNDGSTMTATVTPASANNVNYIYTLDRWNGAAYVLVQSLTTNATNNTYYNLQTGNAYRLVVKLIDSTDPNVILATVTQYPTTNTAPTGNVICSPVGYDSGFTAAILPPSTLGSGFSLKTSILLRDGVDVFRSTNAYVGDNGTTYTLEPSLVYKNDAKPDDTNYDVTLTLAATTVSVMPVAPPAGIEYSFNGNYLVVRFTSQTAASGPYMIFAEFQDSLGKVIESAFISTNTITAAEVSGKIQYTFNTAFSEANQDRIDSTLIIVSGPNGTGILDN
jgi:hypothetical protein